LTVQPAAQKYFSAVQTKIESLIKHEYIEKNIGRFYEENSQIANNFLEYGSKTCGLDAPFFSVKINRFSEYPSYNLQSNISQYINV
jgi:hypothetical protein